MIRREVACCFAFVALTGIGRPLRAAPAVTVAAVATQRRAGVGITASRLLHEERCGSDRCAVRAEHSRPGDV